MPLILSKACYTYQPIIKVLTSSTLLHKTILHSSIFLSEQQPCGRGRAEHHHLFSSYSRHQGEKSSITILNRVVNSCRTILPQRWSSHSQAKQPDSDNNNNSQTFSKLLSIIKMRESNLSRGSVSTQTEDSDVDFNSPLSGSPTDSAIGSPRYNLARPLVVSVEGNIGSGKSTLMKYFQGTDSVEALPEPIAKWTNLNGHNALSKLYEDASRWSFSFNTYASLTRCQMHETATDRPVVLLERSLYSTRYCFVENDYQNGTLHDMEYHILDRWFDYLCTHERLPIDLFVYLRADPAKCYERLKVRNRTEETGIPMKFIQQLHDFHEWWLMEKKYPVPAPVLVMDANQDKSEMRAVYDEHRSKILFGHV